LQATKNYNNHCIYTDLVTLHGDRLYRFCLKLSYSKEDADDLWSDTMLTVMQRPEKILAHEAIDLLLFGVASNLFKSKKRTIARRMRLVPTVAMSLEDQHIIASADDTLAMVESSEVSEILNQFILQLPVKFKVVLVLFYTLELSVEEIATSQNLPKGTVMSRLKRGREHLRKKLMEVGINEENYK